MAQKRIIQQLLAGLLLLVFSFSITPRKFLHDAFANHKDKSLVIAAAHGPQLSHTGFVCKCDNQVAESPFTSTTQCINFFIPRVFTEYQHTKPILFFSSRILFFQRRGPPTGCDFV